MLRLFSSDFCIAVNLKRAAPRSPRSLGSGKGGIPRGVSNCGKKGVMKVDDPNVSTGGYILRYDMISLIVS
jgi:hypothetical protein